MPNLSRSLRISTAVALASIGGSAAYATDAPAPAANAAATPSFRCEAAATAVDTAICADPKLAESDAKLAAGYQQLRRDVLGRADRPA